MKPLQEPLEKARAQFCFSGYQLYAKKMNGAPLSLWGGMTSRWPGAAPVGEDTLFDIGSVSKAVATTTLFALGVDKGELKLEDTLGRWVPELAGTRIAKLEIRHLLSHSAGILWWHPVFKEAKPKEFAAWAKRKENEICVGSPGESAVYSDIGFLLLGLVIEKQWGEISEAFRKRIAEPLGLVGVGYGPVAPERAAATEFHLGELRVLQGEVFDDNARGWGGHAAHAGLFSSARSLAVWAEEWLKAWHGKSKWLGEKTAKLFSTRSGLAPKSTWALGWDTKSESGSSAGNLFSERSFGHLGYPGCSVWIDPKNAGFAILHTNRVHPSRLDERIREWRPVVHDAVAKCW